MDGIRHIKQMAGIPVEDLSEEGFMRVQPRTREFAVSEARDLAGMNDYRPRPVEPVDQTEEAQYPEVELARRMSKLATEAAGMLKDIYPTKAKRHATEAVRQLRYAAASLSKSI